MKVFRAFLSHSSIDKPLVRAVAEQLNAANTLFDERSFEPGEDIQSEIVAALGVTDVFVLFYSNHSAKSEWVTRELAIAEARLAAKEIAGVLVVRIDDSPLSGLPPWILRSLVKTSASPNAISAQIRGKLLELSLAEDGVREYFVNRDRDQKELRRVLASVSQACPVAIFVSGIEGIGRRTLLKRVFHDTFSKHLHFPLQIELSDNESDVDLFRRLFYQVEDPRFTDAASEMQKFERNSAEERARAIAQLIDKVAGDRGIVFIKGHGALLTDDGDLQLWLQAVLTKCKPIGRPSLALICRRMVRGAVQQRFPAVFFWSVGSLPTEESQELIAIWLRELQVKVDLDMVHRLLEACSGHPKQIEVAARIVSRIGVPALQLAFSQFVADFAGYARQLLDSLALTPKDLRYLSLFNDFRFLSAQDLVVLTNDDDATLGAAMLSLQMSGVVETDGMYLRVPSFLMDAISRINWTLEDRHWLEMARKRFLEHVKSLVTLDSLSIDAIDKANLAALRSGDTSEAVLLLRPFVSASHFLRLARERYDEERYADAAEFCNAALEKSYCLTDEATIEALRLKGMAEIRNGNHREVSKAVAALREFPKIVAKRHAHFLEGFEHRMAGRVEQAEKSFRAAFSSEGGRSFHILRELAYVLMVQGRHAEAEQYARKAYETAPQNAHVIDMLLEVIIETRKDDPMGLANDQEVAGLFKSLESASDLANRSFYDSRMSHYLLVLRKLDEAFSYANRAVQVTPKFVPVHAHRARVALAMKRVEVAEADLKKMDELVNDRVTRGDRRNIGLTHELRILIAEAKKDFSRAIELLDRSGPLAQIRVKELKRTVALSIITGGIMEKSLVDWANQVMSGSPTRKK